MLREIIKVKAEENYLKIYFFQLFINREKLANLEFDERKIKQILENKTWSQISSKELFRYCSVLRRWGNENFTDYMPNYLFYIKPDDKTFSFTMQDHPRLFTNVVPIIENQLYEVKCGFDSYLLDRFGEKVKIIYAFEDKNYYDENEILSANLYDNGFYNITQICGNLIEVLYYDDNNGESSDLFEFTVKENNTRNKKDNGEYIITQISPIADIDYLKSLIKKLNNAYLLKFASSQLFNDHNLISTCVDMDGKKLEFANETLRDNFEIVLKAVKNNGYALRFTSDKLKNNKEIVLAAVKNFGPAIQYASEELHLDKEVQENVIQYFGKKFEDLESEEYSARKNADWAINSNDDEMDLYQNTLDQISNVLDWLKIKIVEICKSNHFVQLKDDQDFIQKVFKIWPHYLVDYNIIYSIASKDLLNSDDFLYSLMKLNLKGTPIWNWSLFPNSFWSNKDRINLAIEIDGDALQFVSSENQTEYSNYKLNNSNETIIDSMNPNDKEDEELPF